ncbi:serine hydrolase [Enterovirga rhinocerotis]|uniref:serine hydrolase n=1 Tax=Enterovirga rhinocerotis TaxID=1339210 RepID=UPI001AAD6111|nr:serine hydrolase [Enterovirga rhinocerotis]
MARRHRPAALALAAVLALSVPGRGAAEVVIDPTSSPSEAVALPVPPARIDAAVARLDELAAGIMRKAGIPGLSVAVVRGGRTVYAKGFGVRQAGEPGAVDAETVFQLASLSKPVGASVVAATIGDGRGAVRWDTPVGDLLPGFALSDAWVSRNVTVGDLYAHRSGLPDHGGDVLEYLGYDRAHILGKLRHLPLSPFRASYAYTNFGVTAAAEAVARASGTEWSALSQTTIYGPLGMSRTSSRFEDFMRRGNRAVPHVKVDGVYRAKYQRDPDAQSPAGGVSSTASDMARWMAMVLAGGRSAGKAVVTETALRSMLGPQTVSHAPANPSDRAGFYGFGIGVNVSPSGRVVLSHSGAFLLGAATNLVLVPSLDLGIVVLSNAAPTGAVEALGAEFADLVQFGTVTRDWFSAYAGLFAPMHKPFGSLVGQAPPSAPLPPAADEAYLGAYANAYFGRIAITRGQGRLTLAAGRDGAKLFRLRHWNGDTFAFDLDGEDAAPGSISTLTFDRSEGKVASLRIEYFSEDAARGLFLRE